MKIIYNFLSRIYIKDSKLLLGRWSINYCHNNINKKIDSGNEDHCGPCGQYDLKSKSIPIDNTKKIIIKDTIRDKK